MGGDYKFSPAFDLGVAYYNIDTTNNPDKGKNYITNTFSILADYNLNKYADVYAGAMLLEYSGEGLTKKAPVLAYANNAMYGIGVRLKF